MEKASFFRRWPPAAAVFLLGSLWHFLFTLAGKSPVVGLFAPVNESTWEHLKILFFPALLIGAVLYFKTGKRVGFFGAWLKGVLAGMGVIVAVFYTYAGILGRNLLVIDILTFLLGVIAAQIVAARGLEGKKQPKSRFPALVVIAALMGLFFLFTFYPPHIGLFMDPVTGGYGIVG